MILEGTLARSVRSTVTATISKSQVRTSIYHRFLFPDTQLVQQHIGHITMGCGRYIILTCSDGIRRFITPVDDDVRLGGAVGEAYLSDIDFSKFLHRFKASGMPGRAIARPWNGVIRCNLGAETTRSTAADPLRLASKIFNLNSRIFQFDPRGCGDELHDPIPKRQKNEHSIERVVSKEKAKLILSLLPSFYHKYESQWCQERVCAIIRECVFVSSPRA